ncbi:unnamed protein product [Musa acuminata subsp. malaccensis]|uniref:AP-3 complex subunit delta n=1 Tax=Musa acuminata subsp. malaccensis TaxID=214687 RepID=A0A804ILU9_MUSAM|nr:PREDICTED: AP-3 complex subunit delta-like [Musa acuminata subsp. malaccensis]CAG1841409.1 unnamed protein product [Musa acuminata subsp. malaccensis]
MAAASASSSSPSLIDTLFQRSLDDLIRVLRSSSSAALEAAAIARALDEIRREIRSPDLDTKVVALQKLTYLASLHHFDMSWAAFHALELLPSTSLPQPRAAYLAASLSFHPSSTDLLPLATHQLRKHLAPSPSNSPAVAAPALHLLALASSPDLARHLAPDLLPILSNQSSNPLRPKAVATALRVLAVCPDTAPVLFKPLVECLSLSSDPRAVSAAIGAFCELALAAPDPSPYLPLAPEFYRLLVDSRNNWVTIKVLKIFARLAPLEPRVAARIVDPVCQLLRRFTAKSLVFECIRTVFSSLLDHDAAVRLAVDKIKEFLASDDDPNLRYLGLQALNMLGPAHSWAVEDSREVVIQSLNDTDTNIRREALRLIMGMLCDSNVVDICNMLIKYAIKSDPEFANEILDEVLATCGRNVYELIVDFDWYVSLLGEMVRNPHFAKGDEIERQLVDVGLRVRDARPELIRVARNLLIDPALLGNPFLCKVLSAAAWVSGEYVEFSRNPLELVEALLQPRTNLLPPFVRAVYVQAVFKILAYSFISFIEQIQAGESLAIGNSLNQRGGKQEGSDLVAAKSSSDQNNAFEIGDGVATADKAILFDSIEKQETFKHESISCLLNLIETVVGPLSECGEVEVQERARNVLGLILIIRGTQFWNIEEGHELTRDNKITKMVELMESAFSEELGPVSTNAQKRVSVPEGLILNENLSELLDILGDDDINPCASVSFSLRNHHSTETNQDSATAIEPNSLLAEHRKRHGLYYLPMDKDKSESNDYPCANEPLLPVSHGEDTEDIVKLPAQSLIPEKAKPTKPRPVVIRLDEGDGVSSSNLSTAKESKDDMLSGAIRDVLLRNEKKPSSTHKTSSDRTSQRRENDGSENSELISQQKESNSFGDREHGKSSSRKSRHHHKERIESSGQNRDNEEKSHRHSAKSSHHHRRHKHRQRGDAPLDIVPQSPVIQDFLL